MSNVLYNPSNGDFRFINLEQAENYDLVRDEGHRISPLQWMHHVAADFRLIFYSFIVTVYCPEEYIPVPENYPDDEPNPASVDCIEQQEMLNRMKIVDPEFDMVLLYMNRESSERTLSMLPPSLQRICRSVGRPHTPPGPFSSVPMPEPGPPGYSSVYPDSLEDEESHFLATIRSEFDKMSSPSAEAGSQTRPGEAGPSGLPPGHGPDPPSEVTSDSNTDDSNIGREGFAAYQTRHEGSETSSSSNHAGTRNPSTPEGLLPMAPSDSSSEIRSRFTLSGFSSNGRETPAESGHASSTHSSSGSQSGRENVDVFRDLGRPRTVMISISDQNHAKRLYAWGICLTIPLVIFLRCQINNPDTNHQDYYSLEGEI